MATKIYGVERVAERTRKRRHLIMTALGGLLAMPMLGFAVWSVSPILFWYAVWVGGTIAFFGVLALLAHAYRRYVSLPEGPLVERAKKLGRTLEVGHFEGVFGFAGTAFVVLAALYLAFLA